MVAILLSDNQKVERWRAKALSCTGPFNRCTSNMYADDTSVTCSDEDVGELCSDLRADLDNIAEWLLQNKLSLNTDKTECRVVGHNRQTNRIHGPLEININGGPINRVKEVEYLGVTVDENLTWNDQCKILKGKIKNALSSLRKLRNILLQTKLDQVYKALLESHLRYSDKLWGSLSNTKLDHLQRLQTRARTLIESSRLKDGWTCNWLSVSNLIIFDRAVMIYEIMNGLYEGHFTHRKSVRDFFGFKIRLISPRICRFFAKNLSDCWIFRIFAEFSIKTWNMWFFKECLCPKVSNHQ